MKGNVLHHSAAYHNFRKEYFVVFDVDQNNDNKPDRVYGWRINKQGQIMAGHLVNFTISGVISMHIYIYIVASISDKKSSGIDKLRVTTAKNQTPEFKTAITTNHRFVEHATT